MFAALIWGLPGVSITLKGVNAYIVLPHNSYWWLLMINLIVLLFFYFVFRVVVSRYSARIANLHPEKVLLRNTFPLKGWLLLLLMMIIGSVMGSIQSVPVEFTAAFYSGLGPMLVYAALRFLYNGLCRHCA